MKTPKVEPAALDYFCKACGGVRIHVLAPNMRRYHCGVCDRGVAVVEVATNYSVRDVDPELLVILDPYASRQRLTIARNNDTMDETGGPSDHDPD